MQVLLRLGSVFYTTSRYAYSPANGEPSLGAYSGQPLVPSILRKEHACRRLAVVGEYSRWQIHAPASTMSSMQRQIDKMPVSPQARKINIVIPSASR